MTIDSKDAVDEIRAWAGSDLQADYLAVLEQYGGRVLQGSILLYSAAEVIERNETFESRTYCPDFITIGDDSGGRAIVIGLGSNPSPVFVVDHGSMCKDDFTQVATDINAWLMSGVPVD